MLNLMVAVAENNVIGKDNKLIWHIPNDLKYFKSVTSGHKILMGRKTFQSLPGILPGRPHLVLTRDKKFNVDDERVTVLHGMEEVMPYVDSEEEVFVVGGAEIYKTLLPYCKKAYITRIKESFEGDAFFPHFDENMWITESITEGIVDEKNKYPHSFYVYTRK